MEPPAKREELNRSERQIVLLPDFCPKHDFLVRKRKMPKKKDELKCRRMPWRIFHEQCDYNHADSFLAWRAPETDNTFPYRA